MCHYEKYLKYVETGAEKTLIEFLVRFRNSSNNTEFRTHQSI